MLRTRAWRPSTNNLRTFSHSCLRTNAQSTSSLSPGPSNVGSQAQPHQETHANMPEGVGYPSGAASASPKVQPADSSRRLDSKISTYDLDTIKQRIGDWMALATVGFKQQTHGLRQRTDEFTQKTSTKLFQLGSQLNRVTGYEQIEALKQRVVEQGMLHFLAVSVLQLRLMLTKRLESRLLVKQLEKLRQRMMMLSYSAPFPSAK
jgi:sensitive to high expression protein 9